MRVEELENKINQLPSVLAWPGYGAKVMVTKDSVLELVRQLDEPKKVVIPQFVAEKIEYCKANSGYSLFHAMDYCFQFKDSADWLECNQDLFARAWLDGYTIEKEKLYTVEIPDPNNHFWKTTKLEKREDGLIRIAHTDDQNRKHKIHNQLTESEIRKDFDWAWQWAEEVKEVDR